MSGAALLLRLAALFALALTARAETFLEVERNGDVIDVTASVSVPVDMHTAWQVLTDYDHLADFVPKMRSSRVLSAPGLPLMVEQKGETGFLVFFFPIEVVLRIEEQPPELIRFESVAGNIKKMQGLWRVVAEEGGVRLSYRAQLTPGFWVPPVIGPGIIKRDVRAQFEGVAREMLKRANVAVTPVEPGAPQPASIIKE